MLRNQFTALFLFFSIFIGNAQNITAEQKEARKAFLRNKIESEFNEKGRYGVNNIYSESDAKELAQLAEMDQKWALDRKLGSTIFNSLYIHDDKALAAKWLKRQADHGNDPEAMFSWAMEHSHIEGTSFDRLDIPQNKEIHLKYLKKAAALNPLNYQNLYDAYGHYGMEEDAVSTLKEMVLLDSDPKYTYFLSNAYRNGKGTARDLNKANILLRKAVDQGYLDAQSEYGKLLYEGRDGLSVDKTKAKSYLESSCAKGSCSACDYLKSKGITPKKKGRYCD